MLTNSRAHIILTHKMVTDTLLQDTSRRVRLDTDWHLIESEPTVAPEMKGLAESLAYVIYTSGSTGMPKGVMIPHRALTNHMLWMRDAFPLYRDDVLLQKTPLSFDASVWEILAPLIGGAKLLLAKPKGHKDPTYLSETVGTNAVTTLQLVPSMLRLFLAEPTVQQCRNLRNVFSGGEALSTDLRNLFFGQLSANLHNLYGPTETCIQAIVYSCDRNQSAGSATVPIGRPISNTQAYVLNDHLELLPIGAEGELYIGGAGLAHGYCRREDLTCERFIDNPFDGPSAKLYRTGDRVRYLSDGNLEFVGRADDQVKLRGFRVELGEIETCLNAHPLVREAALAAVDDASGHKKLVAYVVPASTETSLDPLDPLDSLVLRDYLSGHLPEFMVPSQVIFTSTLPRLPSGKLDRIALSSI
jgi:amino acid adenylation domain-containing protein